MLAFYPLTLVQTAMLFATMATWTAMVDDKSFTGLLTARNNVSMIPNPDVMPPLVSTPSSDRPGPQRAPLEPQPQEPQPQEPQPQGGPSAARGGPKRA